MLILMEDKGSRDNKRRHTKDKESERRLVARKCASSAHFLSPDGSRRADLLRRRSGGREALRAASFIAFVLSCRVAWLLIKASFSCAPFGGRTFLLLCLVRVALSVALISVLA